MLQDRKLLILTLGGTP